MTDYSTKWPFQQYEPPEELKEGTRYIQDILHEVAEEEGMSKKEIRDVWNHQKRYIKQLMDKPGIYSIDIPFLGTLCYNTKYFDKFIEKKWKKDKYKGQIQKSKEIKEHSNYTLYSNAHKRVPGVLRMARSIIRRFETGIKKRKLIAHKKCIQIISNFSNELYNKKDGVR